jgi:hypothetical protein
MIDLVVQRFEGTEGVTREQLEAMMEMLPYGESLVPYATTGLAQDGETQFSVFGFMKQKAMDKLNESVVDAFNATVLREAEKKMPPGVHKGVTLFGMRIAIRG